MASQPLIFAHRGASAVAPENTLPAFTKALEMGADGIELDVQATAEGELVVLHDFNLEGTTTGRGRIRKHTLAQLSDLDAGIRFNDAFSGTPIPTLDQVFELTANRCIVNVEIKNMDWDGGPEAGPLTRMIQRRRLYDKVIVSSFNPFSLRSVRQLDPHIPIGLLYKPKLPRPVGPRAPLIAAALKLSPNHLFFHLFRTWSASILAPDALHPHFQSINSALMAEARRRGQIVNAWTVNCGTEARRLAALGVNAIITDRPDAIRQALSEAGPVASPSDA
ncbi:MAG: glycerophosphodiester phosphodiesterase family protein [Caldilineaceae bacterium]|nr:glycerophosphodiester phosphodiesterase family protein [Caldilineaceae bacterium]